MNLKKEESQQNSLFYDFDEIALMKCSLTEKASIDSKLTSKPVLYQFQLIRKTR
jgi:hypothetical protein